MAENLTMALAELLRNAERVDRGTLVRVPSSVDVPFDLESLVLFVGREARVATSAIWRQFALRHQPRAALPTTTVTAQSSDAGRSPAG